MKLKKLSEFGIALKRLRQAEGLSQPQLAERLDIAVSSIRHWEQGRKRPVRDDFFKVLEFFDVPAAMFAPKSPRNRTKPKR